MPQEPGAISEHVDHGDELQELENGKVVGKKIEDFINLQPDEIRNPLSEIITNLVGEIRPLIFPKIETDKETVHPAEYNSRVESNDGKYRIGIHAEATSPEWESVIIEKKLDKNDKPEGPGMTMASRDIFQVKLYSDGRLEIYIDSRHIPEVKNIQDFTTNSLFNENLYFLNSDLDLSKLSPEAKALIVRLINETTDNIKNSENFEKLKEKRVNQEPQMGTEGVNYSPFEYPHYPFSVDNIIFPELNFPSRTRPEPFWFGEYKNQQEFERGNEKMLIRQTQNFIEEDLIYYRFKQEYYEATNGRSTLTSLEAHKKFIEEKKAGLTELEQRALTEEISVEEANRLRTAYRAKRNLISRLTIALPFKDKVNTFGLDITQVESWGLEQIETWVNQKEKELQGAELEDFRKIITNHSGDPIPIVWKDYKDYKKVLNIKFKKRVYTLPDGSHSVETAIPNFSDIIKVGQQNPSRFKPQINYNVEKNPDDGEIVLLDPETKEIVGKGKTYEDAVYNKVSRKIPPVIQINGADAPNPEFVWAYGAEITGLTPDEYRNLTEQGVQDIPDMVKKLGVAGAKKLAEMYNQIRQGEERHKKGKP